MDGAGSERWSSVAAEWAHSWGAMSDPARRTLVTATGITVGTPVLDVGCGSGEFLSMLNHLGAAAAGADPAPEMVRLASRHGDARLAEATQLPWPDRTFDVVTAINALQFADPVAALAEFERVLVPGGAVGVANWAEAALNDLDTIEAALALADGEEPTLGGPLREPGGLEDLFQAADLRLVEVGVVEVPWTPLDDDSLVRGVLMGEDPCAVAQKATTVIASARPFRTPSGGYHLVNTFRYAVARTPT